MLGAATISAEGGSVPVRLDVHGATRCRFTTPAPGTVPGQWVPCDGGVARALVHFPSSGANVPLRRHVTGWVLGPGGRTAVVAFLVQAPVAAHVTPKPASTTDPSPGAVLPPSPVPSAVLPTASTAGPGVKATPLSIVTTALPVAAVGVAYATSLTATGGAAPYTWTLVSGSLPAGITLAPGGTISGVPTATGTSTVTVGVSDSATPAPASATATLSLSVVEPPYSGQGSTNWSGYVVSSPGPLVTEAVGRWTVPTLDCSATPNGGAATWVGIGGALSPSGGSSGVLLQTGITTDCVSGSQVDHAWWEHYPSSPNNEILFTGVDVAPGDSIEASVYQAASGAWVTRVDDLTTHVSGVMVTGEGWGASLDGSGSFSTQGSTASLYYSGGTSAEWIVEDYQESGTLVPLADYGTITFSELMTSLPAWSLMPTEAVELIQSGTVASTPSAPSSDSFSVTYTAPVVPPAAQG